jgi:hypothetical protein
MEDARDVCANTERPHVRRAVETHPKAIDERCAAERDLDSREQCSKPISDRSGRDGLILTGVQGKHHVGCVLWTEETGVEQVLKSDKCDAALRATGQSIDLRDIEGVEEKERNTSEWPRKCKGQSFDHCG